MTDLVTADSPGAPDPAPGPADTTLLAEVRESVLRLVAELPSPPGSIRISVLDIAVELEWPAADQQGHSQEQPTAPVGRPGGQPEPGRAGPASSWPSWRR